jgi:hypothetical protein
MACGTDPKHIHHPDIVLFLAEFRPKFSTDADLAYGSDK